MNRGRKRKNSNSNSLTSQEKTKLRNKFIDLLIKHLIGLMQFKILLFKNVIGYVEYLKTSIILNTKISMNGTLANVEHNVALDVRQKDHGYQICEMLVFFNKQYNDINLIYFEYQPGMFENNTYEVYIEHQRKNTFILIEINKKNWVMVTDIRSEDDFWHLYDCSSNSQNYNIAQKVLSNTVSNSKLQIINCQQRENENDNGLYSLAFIYLLIENYDLESTIIIEQQLLSHFYLCKMFQRIFVYPLRFQFDPHFGSVRRTASKLVETIEKYEKEIAQDQDSINNLSSILMIDNCLITKFSIEDQSIDSDSAHHPEDCLTDANYEGKNEIQNNNESNNVYVLRAQEPHINLDPNTISNNIPEQPVTYSIEVSDL